MIVHTCGIFLISKERKLLIGQIYNQKRWSIPKGKNEIGEDYLDAALRELYEEANVKLEKSHYTFHEIPEIRYKHQNKILHSFYVTNLNETDFKDLKCNSFTKHGIPELVNHQWVSLKDAQILLHPSQAKAIEHIYGI